MSIKKELTSLTITVLQCKNFAKKEPALLMECNMMMCKMKMYERQHNQIRAALCIFGVPHICLFVHMQSDTYP